MIGFVRGIVEVLSDDYAVIDTGSIGYNIKISSGTAAQLPGMGEEVKLYTYTSVREDAISLFGFLSRDDLEIFKKLITVNGIGPKGGLSILSVMSADDLRFAILAGDAKAIAKAPGIGGKTAERVILDLRDKITLKESLIHQEMNLLETGNADQNMTVRNEAAEALTALGYSASEALAAIKKVPASEDITTEMILKQALKNMF